MGLMKRRRLLRPLEEIDLLYKCRLSPPCISQEPLLLFCGQIVVTITFNGIITNFVFFIHRHYEGQASKRCQRRRILLEPDCMLNTTMDFSVAKGVFLSNGDCEITGKQIVSARDANPLCTRMINMRRCISTDVRVFLTWRSGHTRRQLLRLLLVNQFRIGRCPMRCVEHLTCLQNHFNNMLIGMSLCGGLRVCVENEEIHCVTIKSGRSRIQFFTGGVYSSPESSSDS